MSREAALTALAALVQGAYPWGQEVSRRLVLWDKVPPSVRPAAFLFEGGQEAYVNQGSGGQQMKKLTVRLFVYTDASDRSTPGSIEINAIMDALDVALKPDPGQGMMSGRNSLGGAAYWCRIEGAPMKEPGDLDGDGLLVVPIVITIP